MRYRVLAKGYSPGNGVRERYEFDLLCTRERAEQVARLYQTHFESKEDGTYAVTVKDRDTGEFVFRKSTIDITLGGLSDAVSQSMSRWVTNSTTSGYYAPRTYQTRTPSWYVNTTGTYA